MYRSISQGSRIAKAKTERKITRLTHRVTVEEIFKRIQAPPMLGIYHRNYRKSIINYQIIKIKKKEVFLPAMVGQDLPKRQ
jgi:hypothetical protein